MAEAPMASLRHRTRRGDLLAGTFLNLGSSVTAEIAALAGFDWLLLDLEHGLSDFAQLLHQLQATARTPAGAVVRVAWNDPVTIKRVLDLGPAGIMVPMVNSAEEATAAVRAACYPPDGIRGVARMNRAGGFGQGFGEYFRGAARDLLLIVQIETPAAAAAAEEIAAVDRVDALFVGPMDLSVNMGIMEQFENAEFGHAVEHVAAAARRHGKAAGILLPRPEDAIRYRGMGYTLVAAGSDSGLVAAGMPKLASGIRAN